MANSNDREMRQKQDELLILIATIKQRLIIKYGNKVKKYWS